MSRLSKQNNTFDLCPCVCVFDVRSSLIRTRCWHVAVHIISAAIAAAQYRFELGSYKKAKASLAKSVRVNGEVSISGRVNEIQNRRNIV